MPARRTAALAASALISGLVLTQAGTSSALAVGESKRIGPFKTYSLGTLGTYALLRRTVGPVAPSPSAVPTSVSVADPTLEAVEAAAVPSAPAEASLVDGAAGDLTGSTEPTASEPPAAPEPAAPAPAPVVEPAPALPPATTSGVALPVGDRPGWRQVVAENFAGTALPKGWGAYAGHPGGEPDGWWDPSHVVVKDGNLRLNGYVDNGRWTTGGVMNYASARTTYGKYEVRFRMPKATGVKYAILLWPASDNWPIDGEIDFAEDGGGNRTTTAATLHYGADNSIIQRHLTGDFSQWHTIGVEWTPGKIVYTIDGRAWASVQSSVVPSGPMNLAIQTETGTCGNRWLTCPDSTTPSRVDMEVDWVAVWARS